MPHQACHQVPVEHCKDLTVKIGKKVCTPQQNGGVGDIFEKDVGGKDLVGKVVGGKKAFLGKVVGGKKALVQQVAQRARAKATWALSHPSLVKLTGKLGGGKEESSW